MEEDNLSKSEREIQRGMKKAGKMTGRGLKSLARGIIRIIGKKWLVIGILIAFAISWFLGIVFGWFVKKENFFDESSLIIGDLTGPGSGSEPGNGEEDDNIFTGNTRGLVTIEDRKLRLDTEEFYKRVELLLKNNNTSASQMGLSPDYRELKAFLEAEIITLYPDLRKREVIEEEELQKRLGISEGRDTRKKLLELKELQGCIKFRRKFNNQEEILLEYTPYEEYVELVKRIGLDLEEEGTNGQIVVEANPEEQGELQRHYDAVKDKFTLDEDLNMLVISQSTRHEVVKYTDWAEEELRKSGDGQEPIDLYTNTIKVKKINYLSQVEKYTMPFELGVALLMVSECPDFCIAVADLAYNSNIEIYVLDNMTIETTYKNLNFKSKFQKCAYWDLVLEKNKPGASVGENAAHRETEQKTVQNRWTGWINDEHDNTNYEIIDIRNEEATTELKFHLVDTWLFYYYYEYKRKDTDIQEEETEVETIPDDEYTIVEWYHPGIQTPEAGANQEEKDDGWSVAERKLNKKEIKEQRVARTWSTTEASKSRNYVVSRSKGRFAAEKFLSLVRYDPENFNEETNLYEFNLYDFDKNTEFIYYKSINSLEVRPVESIENSSLSPFFYKLLNKNNKTKVDFAEIFKYLFALYEGKAEYDENKYEEYAPEDFENIPWDDDDGDGNSGGGRRWLLSGQFSKRKSLVGS